jgi:hypothetical protein
VEADECACARYGVSLTDGTTNVVRPVVLIVGPVLVLGPPFVVVLVGLVVKRLAAGLFKCWLADETTDGLVKEWLLDGEGEGLP